MEYIQIPGGKVISSSDSLIYQYHITDHQGNIRVSYTKGTDGKAQIVQENHYYPFGMMLPGMRYISGQENKHLYNGKEFQDDYGFDMYDYGFRFYDPQLGRWHAIDPLAENTISFTPYHYCLNNPVNYTDFMGLSPETATNLYDSRRTREPEDPYEGHGSDVLSGYDYIKDRFHREGYRYVGNGRYVDGDGNSVIWNEVYYNYVLPNGVTFYGPNAWENAMMYWAKDRNLSFKKSGTVLPKIKTKGVKIFPKKGKLLLNDPFIAELREFIVKLILEEKLLMMEILNYLEEDIIDEDVPIPELEIINMDGNNNGGILTDILTSDILTYFGSGASIIYKVKYFLDYNIMEMDMQKVAPIIAEHFGPVIKYSKWAGLAGPAGDGISSFGAGYNLVRDINNPQYWLDAAVTGIGWAPVIGDFNAIVYNVSDKGKDNRFNSNWNTLMFKP